jgi:hypothetical protein
MRKIVTDVIIKMKCRIDGYSQDFSRIGPGYGGLIKFIIVYQYGVFPEERYIFSFIDVEFHLVCNALTLYSTSISGCNRLQSSGNIVARQILIL